MTLIVIIIRGLTQYKVSSNILTLPHLQISRTCYKIVQTIANPTTGFPHRHLMSLRHEYFHIPPSQLLSKMIQHSITTTLEIFRSTYHGPFKPIIPSIIKMKTMIPNRRLIKSSIQLLEKQKRPGYDGQQILKRKD